MSNRWCYHKAHRKPHGLQEDLCPPPAKNCIVVDSGVVDVMLVGDCKFALSPGYTKKLNCLLTQNCSCFQTNTTWTHNQA